MRRAARDTHEYARCLASLLRDEGHRAHTARLFTAKSQAALVLIEGGKAERQGSTIVAKPNGKIFIWPNRMVREGFVPLISPCFYCEGAHAKHLDGTYSCSVGHFVEFAKTFPSLRTAPLTPWWCAPFSRGTRLTGTPSVIGEKSLVAVTFS